MRLAGIACALAIALPSLAAAGPLTFGAGLGRIQSKENAGADANAMWQLFGRVGLTNRIGIQVEAQKIEEPSVDVRSGTALLVVELGGKQLVPLLIVGYGIDKATGREWDYYEASGSHTEGGFGLEYRADGGLVIGADVRLGGRSVDDDYYYAQPVEGDVIAFAPGGGLAEGEYRSARITAGIRF
jgi:hypothetical protein